jgi:protein-S-isoprenylcysteine O-methyltransferase Ste14
MKATKIEFRLRMIILIGITAVGFWAPWIQFFHLGSRFPLWGWLAMELNRLGILSAAAATPVVLVIGALIAAKGALLRIWGTAWLGYGTVHDGQMQAGSMVADGPFRFVRNPLYLGGWCTLLATSFIMPATGALFADALLTVFFLRLILAEEAFLSRQWGEPYRLYLRLVPRLIPRWWTALAPSGRKPQWGHAILTEINTLGVFAALAFFSWSYNTTLMLKVVLISFGVAMIVRALMPNHEQKNISDE